MKRLLSIAALSSMIGLCVTLAPESVYAYAKAYDEAQYEEAWEFVCDWECGEAAFEEYYGGYTVHGYASVYFPELPESEYEAYSWAYYDFWKTVNCEQFSTSFSQTVCLDTAFLHGVQGWHDLAASYWEYSDDGLACKVVDDRTYWHNDGSYYSHGWLNRDAALAEMGGCWE